MISPPPQGAVRIMGVDPGYNATGYGIIDAGGNNLDCVTFGVIKSREAWPRRLGMIHEELLAVIGRFGPHEISVEQAFHAKNPRTTLKLGHVRGAILLAALAEEVSIHEYTPLDVKKSLVGYGRADKAQIQFMVRRFLSLKEPPEPHDASDALALAVCHANARKLKNVLEQSR